MYANKGVEDGQIFMSFSEYHIINAPPFDAVLRNVLAKIILELKEKNHGNTDAI
mgnify:FL=1